MGAVDERRAGLASGVNNAMSRVASVLAIAVFGPVVLSVFTSSLESRLDRMDLAPADRAALLEQSVNLGAAHVPSAIDANLQADLALALDEAFVDGYRAVIYMTAALAVLASLTAMGLIHLRPVPVAEVGAEAIGTA